MSLPLASAVPVRSSAWPALLLPLLTVLIWSGNTIVTRSAASVIAPSSISFYRWLCALLVLLPVIGPSAWRRRAAARGHWGQLVVLAALGMVIYQSLAYQAARTTTAMNMGVIVALSPVLAACLASALAGERLRPANLLGGLLSLAGLVWLTAQGDPARLLAGDLHVGDALMLVAVVANALYGVLLRRWPIPLPLGDQLFWQIALACLMLLPGWLMGPMSALTRVNLPLILFAAVPASLVAPWCWMAGIRRLGAAYCALFLNLLPVVVAGLAAGLLGEQLHGYHLIGGGLALAGVALGSLRPR